MTAAVMARTTLPERFFPLGEPADIDRLLGTVEWCAIFKAGTGDTTFDAWLLVQKAFEPRGDVAVGLIQIPAGRAASDHVAARTGITHKSPQLILFHRGHAVGHLDERAIQPEPIRALMQEHLPSTVGPPVVNERVVSLDGYRRLLEDFTEGRLPEERFQWSYLERLEKESAWRDDETFDLLNGLFENVGGREVRPGRLVAHEFQGQLAGRLEPLKERAVSVLERIRARESRQ
jgi:bacillithiol system protein YtxJ